MINTMSKRNLGRKGLISNYNLQSFVKGTQGREGPGGRNWSRHHGEMLLTGLVFLDFSACILILSRTFPGMAACSALPTEMDPPISVSYQDNFPTDLSIGQSDGETFSMKISFPQIGLGLCPVNKNQPAQWSSYSVTENEVGEIPLCGSQGPTVSLECSQRHLPGSCFSSEAAFSCVLPLLLSG